MVILSFPFGVTFASPVVLKHIRKFMLVPKQRLAATCTVKHSSVCNALKPWQAYIVLDELLHES